MPESALARENTRAAVRASIREAITLTLSNEHLTDGSEAHAVNGSEPHVVQHSENGAGDIDINNTTTPNAESAAPNTPTFSELGVGPDIVRALRETGIEHTFAIQELTLPLALRGEDLIGQARTGTGKTLGFGVPLLDRLDLPGDGTPQALVVVPTRELCLQVTRDLKDAAKHLGVRTLAVYGGRPYEEQTAELKKGVDLVIGTPGRLLDLADQQQLILGKVRGLVLDEADEMLDLGFLPDIERILTMVPEQRHTMLFSATMPGPIITLARTFLQQPTHIRAEEADEGAIHERTRQFVYRAHAMDKNELVARTLQAKDRGLTMIFTRTKRTAQKLSDDLAERGFAAAAVHGDLGQGAREKALRAFRSGKVDTLVATDVAARGIDVEGVTHVVNLQCPDDEKTYVHRIGRTGRAGREGVAITLVDWDEEDRWKTISNALKLEECEPVETYSTSPHLYTDLDIPSDTSGRLPLSQRTRAGLDAEHNDEAKAKRKPRRRSRGAGEQKKPETDGARREGGDSRPASRRRRRTRSGVETTNSPAEATTAESTQEASNGDRPARRRRRRRSGSNEKAGE